MYKFIEININFYLILKNPLSSDFLLRLFIAPRAYNSHPALLN